MARNRDFKFWVKATDEALMFAKVDIEAEGLYSKMRRDAFNSDPRGFLIDFRRVAISPLDMADGYGVTNGRFKARFEELHARQIIQTGEEYEAALRSVSSGWASKKLLVLREVFAQVRSKPAEVFVIPSLVDDLLDSIVGQRTALSRSKSVEAPTGDPYRGGDAGEAQAPPTGGPSRRPRGAQSHSQISDSKPTSKSQSLVEERNARDGEQESGDLLQMQSSSAPWSWSKHLFLCDAIRKWRAKLPPDVLDDRDRYSAFFGTEFNFELDVFEVAQDFFQHGPADAPVPPACLDGYHVPDETGRCRNCRAKESA
jgi:hypothetical protein